SQVIKDDHVQFDGDRWSKGPANALSHIVRDGLSRCRTHVAGHTGRCRSIIYSDHPFVPIKIEPFLVRLIQNPMLGFLVHLDLRMVRTEVALTTSLRLTRLRYGERVPRVTVATASRTAIWIDPTDAGVWPRRRVEMSSGQHFYYRTMALPASCGSRSGSSYDFSQKVVGRGQYLASGCMMTALLLVDLPLMTARTILRRHQGRNEKAVVLHGIRI